MLNLVETDIGKIQLTTNWAVATHIRLSCLTSKGEICSDDFPRVEYIKKSKF